MIYRRPQGTFLRQGKAQVKKQQIPPSNRYQEDEKEEKLRRNL